MVEQLRAAIPPPDDDLSESGCDALPGAAHELDYAEPPAQFGDTMIPLINDDSGVVVSRKVRLREHPLSKPCARPMTVLHALCPAY